MVRDQGNHGVSNDLGTNRILETALLFPSSIKLRAPWMLNCTANIVVKTALPRQRQEAGSPGPSMGISTCFLFVSILFRSYPRATFNLGNSNTAVISSES